MARQAALEMDLEGKKLTHENLIKFMLPVNEMGRDLVTAEDLEDLFYALYPNEKRPEQAEEKSKTLTPIEMALREKWLIDNILKFGLQGVIDIQKTADGRFVIKYERYTRAEIENYVEGLFKKKT